MQLNKVIQGDCLKIMKDIPDNSIDLVLTDPPYNQGFSGKGSLAKKYDYRREEIKKMSDFNPEEFLKTVKPKLKIFNAFIWTSKNLLLNYLNWAKDNKFNWNILIWAKKNPIPAYNNSLLPDIEYCIYIREKGAYFNNSLTYDEYRKVMWDRVAPNKFTHPTEKHQWMIAKMLKIGSKENDTIFDPFLGSGTTAVAAQALNRNFIGIEIDPKYCEIARQRLRQKTLL